MPHAHHFLERLDRVPRVQVDFALSLYRDERMLRGILAAVRLDPDEERVALSLAGTQGPYVVVTRDGHFVTALGEGMSTGRLRVVPRAHIDSLVARVNDGRARFKLANEIVAPGKRSGDLLGLLEHRPHWLSREEVRAIGGWGPILWGDFIVRTANEHVRLFDSTQVTLLRKLPARVRTALARNSWLTTHAQGARWMFSTMGDLAWLDRFVSLWDVDYGPSFYATSGRLLAPTLRGLWAAARMGKPLLPIYRRVVTPTAPSIVVFDAALAVTAIALRHARLVRDARGILAAIAAVGPWSADIAARCVRVLDDPEGRLETQVATGREVFGMLSRAHLTVGSPDRYARDEDVPRELALLTLANLVHWDAVTGVTIDLLPWVARLHDPEDLYFPEALRSVLPMNVTEREWMARCESSRTDILAPPQTVTRGPRQERNAPCACGSGKKYKRCCGG